MTKRDLCANSKCVNFRKANPVLCAACKKDKGPKLPKHWGEMRARATSLKGMRSRAASWQKLRESPGGAALLGIFEAGGAKFADVTPSPSLAVTMPIRTVSEANMREHWGKKYARKRKQQGTVALFLGNRKPPKPPLKITLTRCASRQLDKDNLAGSFKHVQDAVAKWLGIDDGDTRLDWRYDQRKGAPKEYAVKVRIEEAV